MIHIKILLRKIDIPLLSGSFLPVFPRRIPTSSTNGFMEPPRELGKTGALELIIGRAELLFLGL